MEQGSINLETFVKINNGVVTGNDSEFLTIQKISNEYKKATRGKDIKKYSNLIANEFVYYNKEKLLRARDEQIFLSKEKLLMQMINIEFVLTYDSNQFYNLGTTYAITGKSTNNLNLKYLLTTLNSKLISYYYKKKFTNESTLTNAISTKNLFNIPIRVLSNSDQQPFIEKADIMLSLNKELQELAQKVQRTLTREHAPLMMDNGLPKKLQEWYGLSFAEFLKELEKKKVKLSLSQKSEWEEYFLQEQQKAVALKTQIDSTDKEIDQMVYELYGLTEDEISIIENS